MEHWDSEKLHKVVKENQAGYTLRNETSIVCKFFLEAVEASKYGWFWKCPNGKDCIYRHCLPPGYVLAKDKKRAQKFDEDEIPYEEILEKERTKIFFKGHGTAVVKETLIALWAVIEERELAEDKAKIAALAAKKRRKGQSKKTIGKLSGKELFLQDPQLWKKDINDEEELNQEEHKDNVQSTTTTPPRHYISYPNLSLAKAQKKSAKGAIANGKPAPGDTLPD